MARRDGPASDGVATGPVPAGSAAEVFGAFLQYPDDRGLVTDIGPIIAKAHAAQVLVGVATDLLALTLLTPPGELGADVEGTDDLRLRAISRRPTRDEGGKEKMESNQSQGSGGKSQGVEIMVSKA